ncbi:hypothetical protein [Paenibacillus lautus]|jgi:hypothetical protein|uniref:hypothetical protein n=1 Tax=Paenibacillus lautus TaxID=1401 RepID=UPI0013E3CDB6|nr:hypothetical protein [Paenibacillus lautus]
MAGRAQRSKNNPFGAGDTLMYRDIWAEIDLTQIREKRNRSLEIGIKAIKALFQ